VNAVHANTAAAFLGDLAASLDAVAGRSGDAGSYGTME